MDMPGAIRWFGARDKIHHVHYRNPRGVFPAYSETWIDEGDTDMLRACGRTGRWGTGSRSARITYPR